MGGGERRTGAILGMIGSDLRLWVAAPDFDAAGAAVKEYADRVRGADGLFEDCLTHAVFVSIGPDGTPNRPGRPLDLLGLGAIVPPAAA